MSTLRCVVPGEAPESDDEGQLDQPAKDEELFSRSIVFGEAPESSSSSLSDLRDDADSFGNASGRCQPLGTAAGAISDPSTSTSFPMDVREKVLRTIRAQRKDSVPSLLITKLRENNISLRNSLIEYVHQTALQTSKEINTIDHDLLRSQMTLQEAVTSYRQMNKNVKNINAALCLSPSLNGIPDIDIRAVL